MNLDDYRTVFTVSALILMLIGALPILSIVIPISQSGEHFSELWILGPDHLAENYPFDVQIGAVKQFFVGVTNHMGRSAYYLVYVKFRNQTQLGPDSKAFTPSPLAVLYEFRFVVANDKSWEEAQSFSILEGLHDGNFLNISTILINNSELAVNYLAMWDSENRGFYYQLFFELWMYDEALSNFKYQDRFVALWLNVTG